VCNTIPAHAFHRFERRTALGGLGVVDESNTAALEGVLSGAVVGLVGCPPLAAFGALGGVLVGDV
jgi:hypothetical protein